MNIKWMDKIFEGPFTIKYWEPQKSPVIYSIMIKPDPKKAPTSFRILYFGHTSKISDIHLLQKHKKFDCWENAAGSKDNLFVGFYPMPDSSRKEREKITAELIDRYKPICNF
jgi:hypothetical protein